MFLPREFVHIETRGGAGFSQYAEGDDIMHGVDLRRDSGENSYRAQRHLSDRIAVAPPVNRSLKPMQVLYGPKAVSGPGKRSTLDPAVSRRVDDVNRSFEDGRNDYRSIERSNGSVQRERSRASSEEDVASRQRLKSVIGRRVDNAHRDVGRGAQSE